MRRNRRKYWRRYSEAPSPEWERRQRFLFFRFFALFGLGTILIVVGIMLLILPILLALIGQSHSTSIWLITCTTGILLPLTGWGFAAHAFDEIASPLAQIMQASEAVSQHDLSARVHVSGRGELRRVLETFNMMVGELQRLETQRRKLTADIAHELRNPIHIIQGNLEGILDGVYEATESHIQSILHETHLLNHLIDDLRTLSMAESGQLILNREHITISSLLGDVATAFRPQAEAKGLNLNLDAETIQTEQLTVDVVRMNQILANLLVNAIRHTPTGGTITLSAQIQDTQIEILVADTGEGISSEELPHIFERFWRADDARTRTEGIGGGLGLAITKQLVELHDGIITVQSEKGKGTCFCIMLPYLADTPQHSVLKTS